MRCFPCSVCADGSPARSSSGSCSGLAGALGGAPSDSPGQVWVRLEDSCSVLQGSAERIPAHLVCMVLRETRAGRGACPSPCGPCAWCSVSQKRPRAQWSGDCMGTDVTDAVFSGAHSARLNCMAPTPWTGDTLPSPQSCSGLPSLEDSASLLNEEVSKLAVRRAWMLTECWLIVC